MVRRPSTRMPLRGFSLIELLVVISIVAVLAAMLFPAIGMVRDQARGMTCLSSLRQIGMAFESYGSDNDGLYPPPYFKNSDGTAAYFTAGVDIQNWYGALIGSLDDERQKASRTFVCPLSCTPGITGSRAWGSSYGYNNSGAFFNWSYATSANYSQGINPGRNKCRPECILLAERWGLLSDGVTADGGWNVVPPWDARAPQSTPAHAGGNPAALRLSHRGRSNYLFLDLHTECFGPWDRVKAGTTAATESSASPNPWCGNQ